MYVCNCFGVTEEQVKQHADNGACTPRQVASACKAGTDCGRCVRRIQALLGRDACPRRELVEEGRPAFTELPPSPVQPQAPSLPQTPVLPAGPRPAAYPEAA
ncbi:(2Fe-2S)-binding protein [Streptomyces sp. NPDC090306]|uniref:(2Fe-2S)-binding protein n=1 Tax=unclassified Streptomyces TaxID=2593676 RepID=UPI0036ED522A